ncbi:MAG: phage tail assembly protein, partial [Mesorhizobium sp.]
SDADYRYLTLRRAITRGSEKIARIRMRPAMLEDIDDWSNAEISNRELLARLCDLPAAVLKKLAWDDAEALMEIFHQVVPGFVFAAAKDDA